MPRVLLSFYRRFAYLVVAAGLVYLVYSLSSKPQRNQGQGQGHPLEDAILRPSFPEERHEESNEEQPKKKQDSKTQGDSVYDDVLSDPGKVNAGEGKSPSEALASDLESDDLAELDFEISPTPPSTSSSSSTQSIQTTKPIQSRTENSALPKFKGPENGYQKKIVDAFLHAWNAYRKYAWGMDELRPISKSGQQWMGVGLTIVDSLDTIIIMGLTDEYKVAREWIANSLNFEYDGEVQLFEMTIRTLGGLLSSYHLTGDELFLNKAIELGNKFDVCFSGVTKIPCNRINLKRLQPSFGDISTAECGSIQLEFRDLGRSSNNSKFDSHVSAVSSHLHGLNKLNGLVSCFLNPATGSFKPSAVSVGASADSYYEYLLKQWIQTGKTSDWLKDDYLEAVEGIQKHLLRYSEPSKLAYVGALLSATSVGHVRNEMEHLSCFLPGTLALGVLHGLNRSHLHLASALTRTCQKMYETMPTGLSPEIAVMNSDPSVKDDISVQFNNRYNAQRPEMVESLFYMYRATRDPTYREWGWKVFQAFETYTRLESGGYASISNVQSKDNPGYIDKMETFYLAETLKYLYLLYSDDPQLLPIDKYVMNTEAHPLPIYPS